MPPPFFNPSPADTDQVLHLFSDPMSSFHEIAERFQTTVPALCLWLSNPTIAQRLADLRSAGAERTRTVAALYMPRTIPVLMRIVEEFNHAAAHRHDDPHDPTTPILQLRERETVRKSVFLLYRLSRFTNTPAQARPAHLTRATRAPRDIEVARAIEAAPRDFDAIDATHSTLTFASNDDAPIFLAGTFNSINILLPPTLLNAESGTRSGTSSGTEGGTEHGTCSETERGTCSGTGVPPVQIHHGPSPSRHLQDAPNSLALPSEASAAHRRAESHLASTLSIERGTGGGTKLATEWECAPPVQSHHGPSPPRRASQHFNPSAPTPHTNGSLISSPP